MAATSNFKRANPRFKPQPTVLVICEDSKSGKRYLQDATLHFRVNVTVEVTHCGHTDPIGIFNEAVSRQNKFDEIYCVIDRDAHPSFDNAIQSAKNTNKIKVIASYPCFEFWLLLHFGYTRKSYTAVGKLSAGDRLNQDLRAKLGMEDYDKGQARSPFNQLLDQFDTARSISKSVLDAALAESDPNPSTQLHELMDIFEQLSKPQPLTPK